MATETYNGWTNYETWNIALWIENDQGSQEYWQEQALSAWKRAKATEYRTREDKAKYILADMLKGAFEEGKDELLENAKMSSSIWADLLAAALSEVDWDEIAGYFITMLGL